MTAKRRISNLIESTSNLTPAAQKKALEKGGLKLASFYVTGSIIHETWEDTKSTYVFTCYNDKSKKTRCCWEEC